MIKRLLANKLALIITGLLALGLVGAAIYTKNAPEPNKQPQDKTENNQPAENQDDSGNSAKEGALKPPEQNTPTESAPKSTKQSVKPLITTSSQDDTNIYVGARVDGATSGTCTLKLSKSGYATVEQTSKLVLVVSYYACQDLVVAKSSLPVRGQWTTIVNFNSDLAEGNSETRTIDVQ